MPGLVFLSQHSSEIPAVCLLAMLIVVVWVMSCLFFIVLADFWRAVSR